MYEKKINCGENGKGSRIQGVGRKKMIDGNRLNGLDARKCMKEGSEFTVGRTE